MNRILTFFKYVAICLIFLTLTAPLLQTTTYINVSIRGSFDVSGNRPTAVKHPYSGVVFLTNIAESGKGDGHTSYTEQNWSEVTGEDSWIKVEEMEEGPYDIIENPWKKFVWEGADKWPGAISGKTGVASDAPGIGGFDVSWKNNVKNIRDQGWAIVPFIPTSAEMTLSGFKVGFRGNPGRSPGGKPARYKKELDRNERVGIGAFVVAIPAKGHFISSVKIRGIDDNCSDASCSGYMEFKSPVDMPTCSSGGCVLDYDNDFFHHQYGAWSGRYGSTIANVSTAICAGPSRDQDDGSFNAYDNCFNDFPSAAIFKLGDRNDWVSSELGMFNAYSLSPNSKMRGQECVGCAHAFERWDSWMWEHAWASLWSRYNLGAVLTGNQSAKNHILHLDYQKDNSSTAGYQFKPVTSSQWNYGGQNYALNTAIPRRELPVMIGLAYGYRGGDLRNAGELCCGEEAYFWDVYSWQDIKFQVHVDFAEKGFKIDTQINSLADGSVNKEEAKSLIDFIPPLLYQGFGDSKFNPPNPNLATGDDINLELGFGFNTAHCIESVTIDQSRTVPNADGDDLLFEQKTSPNALGYPLALGETVEIGSNNSDFSFFNLDYIEWNYDIQFYTFEPRFVFEYLDPAEAGRVGEIGIGSYLRENDWNNGDRDTIEPLLREQLKSGAGANNTFSCGFKNYYQELTIDPNYEDFYYFDKFGTFNADVYAYNIYDDSTASDTFVKYDDVTSGNVAFAIEPFTVLAQVYSTNNAKVIASFKKFPEITISSLIGSNLVNKITPNRVETSPANRDLNDPTKNLIFSDQSMLYVIQPNPDAITDPNAFPSLKLEISRKLQRLYLKYNDIPQAIFTDGITPNPDNSQTGSEIIIDNTYESLLLPNGSTVSNNRVSFLAGLSGDANNGYELNIPFINYNLDIFIDLVPFQVYPKTTTQDIDEIIDIMNSTTNIAAIPTIDLKISAKVPGSITATELMDYNTKTTGSPVTLNILMETSRELYYIFDIIEVSLDDAEAQSFAPVVDMVSPTPNPVSRIGDIYNNLKSNLFSYLSNFNGTEFLTNSIISDVQVYVAVEKFHNVQYRLLNGNKPNEQANGDIILQYDGFIARGPVTDPNAETAILNRNTSFTSITEGNMIYVDGSTTSAVGFRRWDNLKLFIAPDAGYYISSLKTYYSDSSNLPDGANTLTELENNGEDVTIELADLPTTPDYISGREFIINAVSTNVWIEVEFKEKPAINSFWLGIDF